MRLLHLPPVKIHYVIIWLLLMSLSVWLGAQGLVGVLLAMFIVAAMANRIVSSSLLAVSGMGALTNWLLYADYGGRSWVGFPYQMLMSLRVLSLWGFLLGVFVLLRRARIFYAKRLRQQYQADPTLTASERAALLGGLYLSQPNQRVVRTQDLHPGYVVRMLGRSPAVVHSVRIEDGLTVISVTDCSEPLRLLPSARVALLGEWTKAISWVATGALVVAGILNIIMLVVGNGPR